MDRIRYVGPEIAGRNGGTDRETAQPLAPSFAKPTEGRPSLAKPTEGRPSFAQPADRPALSRAGNGATRSEAEEAPLSFGQLRLWFLDQLEQGTALYNMPMALRLKGPLDREALQRALNALVARHEALRTRFVCRGEYPVQVIDENAVVEFEVAEGTEVERLIREEINRPFNLSTDRLLRVKLLRVAAAEHVLIVTMHHIVSDEWSLKIFFNELGQLYEAFAQGRRASLPELPIQYADYAIWQRDWMRDEVLKEQVGYWRERLAGRQGIFEITRDRPRRGVPSFRGSIAKRELGPELTARCRELEKQQHVTGFMLHLAAFQALLLRYTQQEDILVGCPIAGRSQLETEGVIGFFVNTLMLRTQIGSHASFKDLLRQVRQMTIDSYGHQDVPIEKLVEELQPERSFSHLPFTRVMFAAQNELFEQARWGALEVEFLDVATDTAKFDLTFLVQGSKGGLIARAEYNSDLFESATIERMLEHYEVLLRDVIQAPDKKLSQLALLTEREKRQVLEEWNETRTKYPRTKCVHQIFEEQAEATPSAIAIAFGEGSLVYRELNWRANQLARYLRKCGVAQDVPVAICAERSVDAIVAMLAVLKAGGAYVPLDPDYPPERLELMLRDTGSPVLLTQQRLLGRFPGESVKPICLDGDCELITRESKANLDLPCSPEQLAYVMYTSGSTGRPKGVAVPHRAVNRLVLNTNYIELGKSDRIALVSNVSFDAATFEIWGALLNGGRLVGIASDVILWPLDFARELKARKITAMFLTSALFNQIASEARDAFEGLKTLIVGGEALDPKWVRRVLRGKPPQRLVNGYGPTENTTFTCCHLITEVGEEQTNIPIGRPISNTQVYILDRALNPVPVGVPGELYAAGDGLARGYWRRHELTAQRFIRNPFAQGGSTELLYKTGDIARFLPNGDIEFLGRLDDQVKVRGFRIELGEIEAALERFAGVKNCAAKVCGTGAEHKRLAVYFVAERGQAPNVTDIRTFLRKTLPAHMQPSAFVQMESLPLTPNGKVDRSALPEPDQARPAQEKTYTAPRDRVEEQLAGIWEDVLGVTPIGIQDKFFDLGGHSLLAVRLVAKIETQFGRKLRLSTIFQAPTIQELSPILRDEIKESSITGRSSIVEIQARGSHKPLFLVHGAGGGMFWGYMNLSRHLGPGQPVYGFRSRGLDGREEFERVEEMAEDYVEDLRRVQPSGPYYLGGYCFGGNVAYEMARLLTAQGEEVAVLALLNCSPPNSRYTQIRVNPVWLWRFARNLLCWKDYVFQWSPAQRRAFFQWKWQQAGKRLRQFGKTFAEDAGEADVGDLVDLSSFTSEERRVWESHIRALLKYRPQPYDGKIHLFRSPSHPLWCSFDPDYGWSDLARGGVTVTVVPGAHEKILEEPCVRAVASELNKLLGKRETASAPVFNGNGNHAAFWKKQLQGVPALLELPTDRPRPATQSGRMGCETLALPEDLTRGLEKLSGKLHVAKQDVLLTALNALLYRYTRQEDIVLGLRNPANLVAVRSSVEGEMPFVKLVGQVREARTGSVRHELPFSKLVEEMQVARDSSYHPVTQVRFAYKSAAASGSAGVSPASSERGGLSLAGEPPALPEAAFDLEWSVAEGKGGLTFELKYAEDLFEARTAQRMLGHLETLLGAIIANPEERIGELPILTNDERRTLLEEWTATEKDYPKDKTLADVFREQVLRTPDAEAVVSGTTRLTYDELYARARVVAECLQAMGIGREDLVGICVERSWEMLAGILGTLLAGAAYVPMDPAYPQERLKFMLEDAGIKVLFSQKKQLAKLPKTNAQILCAEEIQWAEGRSREDRLLSPTLSSKGGEGEDPEEGNHAQDHGTTRPRSNDLAYVIYTSGSSGKPKGVAIEHRSAVAFVYWAKDVFTPEELSGVLASTSICFDLSIFEMFVPLGLGGRIILAENALALPALPAANEVRMVNTVPSAARELVRVKGIPESVQVINLAGEPLATSQVDALYAQTSVKKVYDLYGPTETTTYSTYTLRRPGGRPSIGRPLANEQVYLLDPKLRPVPIGVPGELFIGGEGLARGYLHRPELTAERFIAHPFKKGARLYRTGDLARWRSDGHLEFLGRMDNQVKIRGFRIELGEIEAALRKQDGVKDVVVVAREDKPGQKRLVAYAAAEKGVTAESLRAGLRKTLPEYMVPPIFVLLEALPLTPNGKVDRKALPAPEQQVSESGGEFVEPGTVTEQQVSSAWAEVLQIRDVGVNKNFFEIGGDSLQAVQVISRLQERLNIKLPLTSVFEAPTIEALAKGIESGRWGAIAEQGLPLAPIPRDGVAPVAFVQERLWFFDQLLPGSAAYNVPAAWRLRGTLNLKALEEAVNDVARRHEALRTSFAYQDGVLSQIIAPMVTVPFQANDLSELAEGEREQQAQALLETEAQRPFDLSHAPLMRVTVLKLSADRHALIVVMHHTICDGWSLGIFLRELETFYQARVEAGSEENGLLSPALSSSPPPLRSVAALGGEGEAPGRKLPDLPIQYADFASWQTESMKGKRLQTELDYWKRKLASAPDYIDLPTDHPESAEPDLKAERCATQLDADLTNDIVHSAQMRGHTPFHALMSALVVTLKKWTGRDEMVIGTVVAGRNQPAIENVIGCFMNFLPIRVNLSDAETAEAIVNEVKSAVIEAQNHQDCPFEKMVEALNPERRLNRNPLYNVALLFQNYRVPVWSSSSLEAKPIPTPPTGALLDLRFEIEPAESGLLISCEYKKDLFARQTIERLLESMRQALEFLTREPLAKLDQLSLLVESGATRKNQRQVKPVLGIASTFTAEPVAEPLRHWLRELEIQAEIEFAPFNQVFQQLLDPASLLRANQNGLNILLLRLQDWQQAEGASGSNGKRGDSHSAQARGFEQNVQRSAKEFVVALRNAAAGARTPWLVCLCPNSAVEESAHAELYRRIEKSLLEDLEDTSGVYILSPAELRRWYPVKDYDDASGDELANVPYTPVFFTALATALVRKYHALKRPPYKVIALDCDHTLWSGVCGEDGPRGIALDPAFLELQKFMRAQQEAGILLCLCSKNNENDVTEVFEHRQDMPLRREHFAAWRLNWRPKSENLKSLAEELRLGLDSFVFIDDNPLECAEMEANCPEVLTLQLPEDPAKIPQFLEHCWVFDHLKLTAEDRKRSEMYQQNRERERWRAQSLSLTDFLAGLELDVSIEPMRQEQMSRAAQLTQRTNQFNFTNRRRTEADLQNLAGTAEIVAVSVKDRFGDYGLTGLLIFGTDAGALDVDTFLLSCRVLGRGVEHRMLAWLGNLAQQRNLNWVDVHFHTSARNRPGLEFLESVGAPFRQAQNGGYLFRFPAGFAAEVVFNPQNVESQAQARPDSKDRPVQAGNSAEDGAAAHADGSARFPKLSRCRQIAVEWSDPARIHQAIEAKTVVRSRGRVDYVPPQNEAEKKLCQIWQRLLRVERVGVRDNFFELGGHSLLAVRLFAEIEKELGRKLPLVTLFQNPTIRRLARALNQTALSLSRSLLVPLQPHGSRPPLFLIHGAGGDVLWGYANLTSHLPPDQPVYGIKSRGQAGQEEFNSIPEMAACYVQEIRRFQPTGPYFLGGYCFGGNVAYEMARQLRAQGEQIGLVLLLDSAPANAGYERVTWWRPAYGFRFAKNFGHWLHDFSKLSGPEQRNYVARKLGALWRKTRRRIGDGKGRPAVDLEDVIDPAHFPENELKLWQIHLDAMSAHTEQPFDGEVVLLRTRGQPLLCSLEDDFCWRKLARGGVKIRFTPGSHENVFMEPNVKALARELEEALEQAHAQTCTPT